MSKKPIEEFAEFVKASAYTHEQINYDVVEEFGSHLEMLLVPTCWQIIPHPDFKEQKINKLTTLSQEHGLLNGSMNFDHANKVFQGDNEATEKYLALCLLKGILKSTCSINENRDPNAIFFPAIEHNLNVKENQTGLNSGYNDDNLPITTINFKSSTPQKNLMKTI